MYKLCQELHSKQSIPIVKKKQIHHLILQYPTTLTSRQRTYKMGRFIGAKGEHIRNMQSKLNISLRILNQKSSRQLSKQFQNIPKSSRLIDCCILIELNNENDSIDTIKQTLINQWNQIDVTINSKRNSSFQRKDKRNSKKHFSTETELEQDSRWQQKQSKQKSKSKAKRVQQQQQQEQRISVPDQPIQSTLSITKYKPI